MIPYRSRPKGKDGIMSIETQFDREEQAIIDAEEQGTITRAEANEQMRDLQRDYREAAHEAAGEAYNRELERW